MQSIKNAKKVSIAMLGFLIAGSLAVLGLSGIPSQKQVVEAVMLQSVTDTVKPVESYQYFTAAERKEYEAMVKAKEIKALYEPKAQPEAVASVASHETERLLAPASAPAAKAVQEKPKVELPSADEKPTSYWYVNANTLNVRSGPGADFQKVGTLKRGDKVGLYRKEGEWAIIRTSSGKVGCILSKYLVDNEKSVARAASTLSNEVTPLAQQIVDYSKTLQGVKYVYGGYSTKGFDCSGFTKYVYAHFGIEVPRSSSAYASFGTKVSRESLRPSDILLFDSDGGSFDVSHVGIYIGGDKFIHASSTKGKVVIASFSGYGEKYYGARRVIK